MKNGCKPAREKKYGSSFLRQLVEAANAGH